MHFLLIRFPELAYPGTRQTPLADVHSWKCLEVAFIISLSQAKTDLPSRAVVTLIVLAAHFPLPLTSSHNSTETVSVRSGHRLTKQEVSQFTSWPHNCKSYPGRVRDCVWVPPWLQTSLNSTAKPLASKSAIQAFSKHTLMSSL